MAVTGNRSDQNNYTLDGVNNNETFFKHYGIRPSLDAIQEFKIQTNITSAEYGEAAGANVNIAVKSGTNNYHGALFEFFRNNVLDARESFSARRQQFRWNQFGGTFGGPIRKDKTFFFGNYEGFRFRREGNSLTTVPTAAMMRGDFSRNVDGTLAPQIYDPLTTRTVGGVLVRDPFPGNIVPSSRFNPVSLEFQKNLYAPHPENRPGQRQNFQNLTGTIRGDDQFTVRVDHQFNDKNMIFGRYSWANNDQDIPRALPAVVESQYNQFRNYVVNYTRLFSPTTIFDFKYGFNHDDIQRRTPRLGSGVPGLVAAGLKGIPASGTFRETFEYPVNINVQGFAGAELQAFVSGPQKTWQFLPALSKVVGTHNLKVGADIKVRHVLHDGSFATITHDRLTTSDPQDTAGITGLPYASFLLGYPSTAGRQVSLPSPGCTSCTEAHMKQDLWHFYVQDDIKVSRNLTVNIGMRYEYSSWYSSLNNPSNASWFDTLGNGGKGQFVWAGPNPITGEPPNTTSTFIEPDKNNWAPRFGLAYLLGQKTTFRTGYAIFYGSNIAWEGNHMRGNYPYAVGQDLPINRTTITNTTDNAFPPIDFATVPPSAQHTARRDNRMPYVQQWNLGIQHQLVEDLVFEVNYVGSKGTRLSSFLSGNDPRPGPGDIQPRRPYPQHLGAFSENRSEATSSYHGLTVKVEKRFAKGLSYGVNYAWSKSMDLNSNWGGTSPQDAYNAKDSIGLSDFDRRHIFSSDFVYLLPKSSLTGVAGALLNGWQTNGIIMLRSGRPLTPTLPFDNANVGARGNFQRPNVVGSIDGPETRQQWFSTSAFAVPAPFTFGNAGRNIIEGPGYASVDFALYKNFMISESQQIQFRSEFFNIFNRTNYNNPGLSFGTPGFGVITGTDSARQIQFALKYLF